MKIGTLCYIERNGKTLMLHRTKKKNDMHEGKWIGLGGKVEQGESPEECIIREVYEESGLTIKNPILKGIMTFPKFSKDEDWYVFLYKEYDFSGNLTESLEGDLSWIDNDKLMDLNLWDGDKLFMQWMEKYKLFSAKFIYEDGELIDKTLLVYEE